MSRFKKVKTKVWNEPGQDFPEREDEDLMAKPNVGIAFSGGGTRSATITLGTLRALSSLGLMQKVRYLSCVSGGCWGSLPYLYLRSDHNEETFLGKVLDPSEITKDDLADLDKESFARTLSKTKILDNILKNVPKGDETFSRALGEVFLKPHKIGSKKKLFSWRPSTVQDIVDRNEKLKADDFLLPRPDRPFWIAGGTLIRMKNDDPRKRKLHFEMSPLYAGVPVFHPGSGDDGRDLGGGYIEPFAFDSKSPETDDTSSGVEVKLGDRHLFTLSDVMGTTGAAPASVFARIRLKLGLPEFRYWSPRQTDRSHESYRFGDGGNLENLGIMPLLRRKVEKIVVFVNTMSPLISLDDMNGDVPELFGRDSSLNQVFDKTKFVPLFDALKARRNADLTVLHKETYRVKENKHYGVEGGWDTTVLWVYNEKVETWEDRLPSSIGDKIGKVPLRTFPFYKTFFHSFPKLIDLSKMQVSLLAHLASWNVIENEDVFREMLS